MSAETEPIHEEQPSLQEEIQDRIAALEQAQKHLKRPSTISFLERQRLSQRLARSLDGLRNLSPEELAAADSAPQAAAEPGDEGGDESAPPEAPSPVSQALAEADAALDEFEAAQPAGLVQRSRSTARYRLPGEHRRGS